MTRTRFFFVFRVTRKKSVSHGIQIIHKPTCGDTKFGRVSCGVFLSKQEPQAASSLPNYCNHQGRTSPQSCRDIGVWHSDIQYRKMRGTREITLQNTSRPLFRPCRTFLRLFEKIEKIEHFRFFSQLGRAPPCPGLPQPRPPAPRTPQNAPRTHAKRAK